MIDKQLEIVKKTDQINYLIDIEDLVNRHPRTLLYGYDTERWTWHTYISSDWGEIVTVVYRDPSKLEEVEIEENSDFVPNKRLYPHACDFEFCKLLAEKGVNMTFTTMQEEEDKQYYGAVK